MRRTLQHAQYGPLQSLLLTIIATVRKSAFRLSGSSLRPAQARMQHNTASLRWGQYVTLNLTIIWLYAHLLSATTWSHTHVPSTQQSMHAVLTEMCANSHRSTDLHSQGSSCCRVHQQKDSSSRSVP